MEPPSQSFARLKEDINSGKISTYKNQTWDRPSVFDTLALTIQPIQPFCNLKLKNSWVSNIYVSIVDHEYEPLSISWQRYLAGGPTKTWTCLIRFKHAWCVCFIIVNPVSSTKSLFYKKRPMLYSWSFGEGFEMREEIQATDFRPLLFCCLLGKCI